MNMNKSLTVFSRMKLRWYQYSLRSLLILMTVFAFACSWFAVKMQRAKRQQEAVKVLEKIEDCQVTYDNSPKDLDLNISTSQSSSSRIFTPSPTKETWAERLLGKDLMHHVVSVGLPLPQIDKALPNLKQLPYLQKVEIFLLDETHDSEKESVIDREAKVAAQRIQQDIPGIEVLTVQFDIHNYNWGKTNADFASTRSNCHYLTKSYYRLYATILLGKSMGWSNDSKTLSVFITALETLRHNGFVFTLGDD